MAKDLGKPGGKESKAPFQPLKGDKPRDGVDEPTKNRQMEFEARKGFPGTNPGPR